MNNTFRFILVAIAAMFLSFQASAVDFTEADALFHKGVELSKCKALLEQQLPGAQPGKEKAAVLWRISRVCLIMGQDEPSKEGKRKIFGEGIGLAEKAIRENPSDPQCYMWHSANVGRECQTHSFTQQAAALPKMMDDLTMILDKLGKTNCSEAWQALAEIYYNHPFKSDDAAINFTRKALMCIPDGEIRICTYLLMAQQLAKRDWSAEKRASAATKDASKWAQAYKTNVDKFSYFDGSLGIGFVHKWASRPLGQMSDKEEAKAIIEYAQKIYAACPNPSLADRNDLKALKSFAATLK